MTLSDILQSKGHDVHSIDPSATLNEVVQSLVSHRCGSLVVCQKADRDGRRSNGSKSLHEKSSVLS